MIKYTEVSHLLPTNSSSYSPTQVAFQNFQPNYFASPEKKNRDAMIESATSNYTVNEDLSVTIKMQTQPEGNHFIHSVLAQFYV